jgi:pimeloyl-ACP methyl ester carboxylesterase
MKSPNSLNVFEYGNQSGDPIIFIHGGAGGVWTWHDTIERLPEYHCILPELPEHGSSQDIGPFSIHDTAKRIIRYIEENNIEGPHLVGLSVGGQVVIEMLALAPGLIKSAVMSGALAIPIAGYKLGIYSETVMSLLYYVGVLPWKKNDSWIRLNMKTSAGMPDSSFEHFKRNFQSLSLNGWKHAMSEYYRYRLPAGLEKANIPVLLIAGAHEKIDVQPTNKLLTNILPLYKSVVLGNDQQWSAAQEHNWSVTLPEICAATIQAWITQSDLPKAIHMINQSLK